jgi:DNA-binding MarR family transcriptional regulator
MPVVKVNATAYIRNMAIGPNSLEFLVWVQLVRSHGRIHTAIESGFKASGLPSLEWYDVLLELERTERPLRASELESKLLVAQYNLSRLLDRLENQNLIKRRPDPEDGRSRLIEITEQGRELRRRMWPIYRTVVHNVIGSQLTAADMKALAELLSALSAHQEPRFEVGSPRDGR